MFDLLSNPVIVIHFVILIINSHTVTFAEKHETTNIYTESAISSSVAK